MDFRLIFLVATFSIGSGVNVGYIVNKLASQLGLGAFIRLDLSNSNINSNSNNNNNNNNNINMNMNMGRASTCFVMDAYGGRRKIASNSLISTTPATDFISCLSLCVNDVTCQDLDWSRNNVCNTYSSTDGNIVQDANYIYARKACGTQTTASPGATPAVTLPPTTISTTMMPVTPAPTPASTTSSTTTALPPTATPSPRPMTPQNPADICSIGYQVIPNQYQLSGSVVHVHTLHQCKMACMMDSNCRGVDYHHDSPVNFNCFKHSQIITTNIKDQESCCTRLVKATCVPKQCFSHPVQDLAALEASGMITILQQYLTIPSGGLAAVPPVQCAGTCVTRTVINVNNLPHNPNTIERLCDATMLPPSEKSCDVSTSAQGDVTTTCNCYGDMCNAFGPDVIGSCLVYYPLDANARDATIGNRNGADTNVIYDILDAQKNFSAKFNGGSYIKVNSLRNTVLSYPISTGGSTPAVTVTVWIRRTSPAGRQAIVNNGPQGFASLDLWTEPNPANTMFYVVKGSVRINGMMYMVASDPLKMTYTDWFFVVLTVTNKPVVVGASAVFYVQLFTLTETEMIPTPAGVTTTSSYIPTTIPSTTTNEALDTTTYPLTIGSQPSATPGIIVAGPEVNHFIGAIDEFYIFRRELNMAELGTVKWISSTMGPLLP